MWFFGHRPIIVGGSDHLPEALGPYEPGCTDVMIGNSKDDGVFVRIYYPTSLSKHSSDSWIPWLSDSNYLNGFAKAARFYNFIVQIGFYILAGAKKIPAAGDGPLHTELGPLKTVVFSHGICACRYFYSTICCELASHGYVVACLEHRDDSAAMTWYMDGEDQKWVPFRHFFTRGEEHAKLRSKQVEKRSQEASRALDLLVQLHEGKVINNHVKSPFDLAQFKGRLDLSAPIMMGHSFGGGTSLLTLARDPRFRIGILLDPWLFPLKLHSNLHEKVDQPILCITSQCFPILPNIKALQKYFIGEQPSFRHICSLMHSSHDQQTDAVFLLGAVMNPFMKKINSEVAIRLNNALIIRFLREHGNLDVESVADSILQTEHIKYVADGFTGAKNIPKFIPVHYFTF